MSRHCLVAIGLSAMLATSLLLLGCSDDNPTEPLPPTKAVITAPTSGATLMADEPVQLEGHGVMSTGQPVYPNRLVWYLGAIPDTTFIATGFSPTTVIPDAGDYTITLVAHESVSFRGVTSVNITMEEPANWDPVCRIVEPINGEDFLPAHVTTVFTAFANDREDGDLDGASVVWTSDREGTLGTGAQLEAALIPDVHQIICTITDSGGQTDADTVSVTTRHRPASPVVDGEFFFQAADFVEYCPGKEISQLIGDCRIDVHEDTDSADMYIDEMGGSISCDTADVCFLQGELAQGNVRVIADGDHTIGGTVRLEFSLFVTDVSAVEGLVRAVETSASGERCLYRSFVRMTLKSQ